MTLHEIEALTNTSAQSEAYELAITRTANALNCSIDRATELLTDYPYFDVAYMAELGIKPGTKVLEYFSFAPGKEEAANNLLHELQDIRATPQV